MPTPLPCDSAPYPPAKWGEPCWSDETHVTVKCERLGEDPVWYTWSPHGTAQWTHQANPGPLPTRIPTPSHDLKLVLRDGRVTLSVRGIPQPLAFGDIAHAVRHPHKPWVAVVGSSPVHPPQPAIWDLAHQRFLTPLREATHAPRGESVHWLSLDQFPLQGFFYAAPRPQAPLCIIVHDGPIKAVKGGWPDKAVALSQAGVHAFYVNFRGSEGLPIPPEEALAGAWGEKDVWDLASAKNHLVSTGKVSSQVFALWGGRAGGFGVLNTVARYPSAFDVAIAVYPLLDPLEAAHLQGDKKLLAQWRRLLVPSGSPLLGAQLSPPRTKVRVYHGMEDPVVPYASVASWVARRRQDGWTIDLKGFEGMGSRFNRLSQWWDYHEDAVRIIAGDA